MVVLVLSVVFVSSFVSLLSMAVFKCSTRASFLKDLVLGKVSDLLPIKTGYFLLFTLFVLLLLSNIMGNIPLNAIPSMFYSVTLTLSLLFWAPIMICVSFTQFKDFVAHLFPYGSPIALILLLPVVELFSQLIRPLTLMIRLSTNLSSGHIMMYMFSYFALLSSVLSPFIYVVLMILFALELCISLLQAYIFVSLISLYVLETV